MSLLNNVKCSINDHLESIINNINSDFNVLFDVEQFSNYPYVLIGDFRQVNEDTTFLNRESFQIDIVTTGFKSDIYNLLDDLINTLGINYGHEANIQISNYDDLENITLTDQIMKIGQSSNFIYITNYTNPEIKRISVDLYVRF